MTSSNDRLFRKKQGSEIWHWCRNCSMWPTRDIYEIQHHPTYGELCNECLSREISKDCEKKHVG